MAPDVAIVGEVRDREALPLLLTLSSGVKGFTTIHAGSARQALTRLRFVCQLAELERVADVRAERAGQRGGRPGRSLHADGGRSESARSPPSRTWPAGRRQCSSRSPSSSADRDRRAAHWSGNLPIRATRALREAGFDVRELLEG